MDGDGRALSVLLSQALADDEAAATNYPWVVEVMSAQKPLEGLDPSQVPAVKKWIARVNTLLHARNERARWAGVCLLGATVGQAGAQLLGDNAVSWLSSLVTFMKRPEPPAVHQHVMSNFHRLLAKASAQPDLRRDATDVPLARFMTQVLGMLGPGYSVELRISVLATIEGLMRIVPGPMRPYTEKVTNAALPLVDSTTESLQQAAAGCLATTPICGKSGSTPSEQWGQLVGSVGGSMHDTLAAAFECLVEDTTYAPTTTTLGLSPLPDGQPSTHASALLRRFSGLTAMLRLMLSKPFSSAVSVPVADIFTVIVRVLDVDEQTSTKFQGRSEQSLLMLLLPAYKCQALSLLAALLERCRSQMVLFAVPISRMLVRELERFHAQTNQSDVSRHVIDTYQLACASVGPSLQSGFVEEMVGYMLNTLQRTNQVDSQSSAVTSVSAIGGYRQERTATEGKRRKTGDGNRAENTAAGTITVALWLSCVQALDATLSLPPGRLADSKRTAIEAWACMLLVSQQANPWAPQWPVADNASCRLAVYRLLMTSLLHGAPNHAPFIHQTIRLFSTGRHDSDREVSALCAQAIAVCSAIIHPRQPCLRPVATGPLATSLLGLSHDDQKDSQMQLDQPHSIALNGSTHSSRAHLPPPHSTASLGGGEIRSKPPSQDEFSAPLPPRWPTEQRQQSGGFAAFGSSLAGCANGNSNAANSQNPPPTTAAVGNDVAQSQKGLKRPLECDSPVSPPLQAKKRVALDEQSENPTAPNKEIESTPKSQSASVTQATGEPKPKTLEQTPAAAKEPENAPKKTENICSAVRPPAPVQAFPAGYMSDVDEEGDIPEIIDGPPDSDGE